MKPSWLALALGSDRPSATDAAASAVAARGEHRWIPPKTEETSFGRSRERAVGLPARALPGGAQLEVISERARLSQEGQSADFPSPQDPGVAISVEASPLFDGPTCAGTVVVLRVPRGGERALNFEALAAGLAHEIKNPLAGLQGSAELLARELARTLHTPDPGLVPGAPHRSGKVRDIYDLDDALLIVTTDRLSAFDVVLPDPIPQKGRVLTELSAFWFR